MLSLAAVSASDSFDSSVLSDSDFNDLSNSDETINGISVKPVDSDLSDSLESVKSSDSCLKGSEESIKSTDSNPMPKYGDTVSVLDTGNDTRDLQTAINSANAGDIINLGPRVYNVSYSQINITKNLTFRGDGIDTAIYGYGYQEGYGNSSSTSVLYVSAPGTTIEGISFISIDPNLAYTDWDTLYGWGLKIDTPAIGVRVNNCSFINYNHGIYCKGKNATITNSFFNGATTRLFTSSDDGGKERGTKCIHLYDVDNCLIRNNTFDGPVLNALELDYGCDYTKILNNNFHNNSYSIYFYGVVDYNTPSTNNIIANNTFTDCGHFEAPYFRDYNAYFTYLPIIDTSNTFLNDLKIVDNTFNLRNYTTVILTPEEDYAMYGGVDVANNNFNLLSDKINPSTIFVFDVQAGLIEQLQLYNPINLSGNDLPDGMYLAYFADADDYYNYDYWISYFGDLFIPANGKTATLSIDVPKKVNGANATVNISLYGPDNEGLTADVALCANSENGVINYTVPVSNGKGSFNLTGLSEGLYYIHSSFNGDLIYKPKHVFENFTVGIIETNLTVSTNSSIYSGQSATVNVSLVDKYNNLVNGDVTLTISKDGAFVKNETVAVTNGKGFIEIDYLTSGGIYNILATFNDPGYKSSNASTTINILLRESTISINSTKKIYSGEKVKIDVSAVDGYDNPITGEAILTISKDGAFVKNETVALTVGIGSINIDYLIGEGNFTVDAMLNTSGYESSTDSLKIEVVLKNAYITIKAPESIYSGDIVNVNITLMDKDAKMISSPVIIIISKDNEIIKNETVNLTDGKASLDFDSLSKPGAYKIEALFEGNDYLKASNDSASIDVLSKNYTLDIVAKSSIVSGESLELNITLSNKNNDLLNDVVIIVVDNGIEEEVDIVNGQGFAKIYGLVESGTYIINGRSLEYNATQSKIVEVTKRETRLNMDLTAEDPSDYGSKVTVDLEFNSTMKNSPLVTVFINDEIFNQVLLSDGKASFETNLEAGNYSIKAIYYGDSIYAESSVSKDIEIKSTEIITPVEDNFTHINHTGNDLADLQKAIDDASPGDVISLDDYNFTNVSNLNITKDITLTSTGASISTDGLNPVFNVAGNLNLNNIVFNTLNNDSIVFINTTDNNIVLFNNTLVKANSNVVAESVSLIKLNTDSLYSNNIQVYDNSLESGMKVLSIVGDENEANGTSPANDSDNGTVGPNGTDPTNASDNGTVGPNGTDPTNASDNGTVGPNGTDNGTNPDNNGTVPVYVVRKASIIEAEDMETVAVFAKTDGRSGKYFEVDLLDVNRNPLVGKLVQIGFNGAIYNRTTNESGGVRLQINLGYAGVYTFAVCFLGDDDYNASFVVQKITVTTQKASLTAPNKSYKANAKTKTLTATLKAANGKGVQGKKLSFTVNGKTYTGTTNANGVASVKVSLSSKKTYSFTVKFAGDQTFSAVTKTAKLTIK